MPTLNSVRRLTLIVILLISAQSLVACGVIYKPSPFWGAGGYTSKDLSKDTVAVNFLTGATASDIVPRVYVLYRCAEIAQERGFDSFVLLEANAFQTRSPYGYTANASATMQMYLRNTPQSSAIERDAPNGYLQLRKGAKYYAADVKAGLEKEIKRE